MLEMCSIASGSSGNCICVGSNNDHILIDAGISGKRIEQGLNSNDFYLDKHRRIFSIMYSMYERKEKI